MALIRLAMLVNIREVDDMDSYIPRDDLRKHFQDNLKKELAWTAWIQNHWRYQGVNVKSMSTPTNAGDRVSCICMSDSYKSWKSR